MEQQDLQLICQQLQQAGNTVLCYQTNGDLLWPDDGSAARTAPETWELPRRSPDGTPQEGVFLLYHSDVLCCVHQERLCLGQQEVILVQICRTSAGEIFFSCPELRQETENQIAAVRQKIFGITNAVSALYNSLEESGRDSGMLLEEQLELLNIIQGNCCRLLRPSMLQLELLKYYQKDEISGETLFPDEELSNFVDSCRNVLGRAMHMTLKAESSCCISANRRRLQNCLLCLILLIRRACPQAARLIWQTKEQGGQLLLSCTASPDGTEVSGRRHSEIQPLYDTVLRSPEEQIVQQFCAAYQAVLLTSRTEQQVQYTLRFPCCQKGKTLSFGSSRTAVNDSLFSPYQIFLSDISDYRFY